MVDTFEAAVGAYQAGDLQDALRKSRAALATDHARAGMLHMLIANIEMKMGEHLKAAESFTIAADAMPQKQAEFLKYAARLFITAQRIDRLAEIGVKAAQLNLDDDEFLVSVCEALLRQGLTDNIGDFLPKLDMRQGRHLQLAINYYRKTQKSAVLKALLDRRYRESPEDSFVTINYFTFGRSVLDFTATRKWAELLKTPDNPALKEVFMRELALSRRFWCDDEALHMRPSIDAMASAQFRSARTLDRRAVRAAGQKLRIGYLSADFCAHATMILLYDVLLLHDRERFEITLFCITEPDAALVQKQWHPCLQTEIVSLRTMTDQQAAEEISRRGIDILVDLKGHTTGARMGIVSGSDAPLKATYLGFPGSVRGVELDYAITDQIVTPDAAKPYYAEKLCRLPESYQCNGSLSRAKPNPTTRADYDLPDDRFVFASFNVATKISPATIDLWARVMASVPESVLWILCIDTFIEQNFKDEFERLGVIPDRIIFAKRRDYAAHISRVGLADLALDTFPCNGHTTTSDLLWGGLPVLTKRGNSFASRVSESLLSAIDLTELVAKDEDDFLAKAVGYATDRQRLAHLKATLLAHRAIKPLFDAERFARHLEQAYEMMAARARDGLAPDHIDVPALPARLQPFL
jgi:predicted O-linked N-acetylglucosamine transferase (SPINDLY family)